MAPLRVVNNCFRLLLLLRQLLQFNSIFWSRRMHSAYEMRDIATDGVAWSVRVCQSHFVSSAKTAEPIEMPFVGLTHSCRSRNHAVDKGKGQTNPFACRAESVRPSICLSVCHVGILTVTHQVAAYDATSVHFGPTIRRSHILVYSTVYALLIRYRYGRD